MEKRKLKTNWNPNSWAQYVILQQPHWPEKNKYSNIINEIKKFPPLIIMDEILVLKERLKRVETGTTFLLQGGDCAETFKEFSENTIQGKLKILLQMSAIISYGTSTDILKLGRFAGQYAKPRTKNYEKRGNITLPIFRGDSINDIKFSMDARTPNPKRLLKAYHYSANTLNLLKTYIKSESANISKINFWDSQALAKTKNYKRYKEIMNKVNQSIKFLHALGYDRGELQNNKFNELFISHEGLLLDYEAALTKKHLNSNKYYASSAHMLWLGDRTRQINSAHVEFLSGIENPIGIKCGPGLDKQELIEIIKKINPKNEKGKIILICRLGNDKISIELPKLIEHVKKYQLNLSWICDPMHGNTYLSKSNYKTRDFKKIVGELEQFFLIHNTHESIPSGVHFEYTPDSVTECLGGIRNIKESELHEKYETVCDPRLNHEQSIELAFIISDLINNRGKND